jgi:hypothetical protein
MKKIILFSLTVSASISLLSSCKKVEGEGGSSTIKGIVIERKYNSVGTLIAEYPAMDADVYILYGSGDNFPDDDIKTSYDGSFEFNYLQPGNYRLYAYEDCNTCASGTDVIIEEVVIDKKKSTVEADTIYIKKI